MATTEFSRREREKNLHKREILDSALKLFSEKGFHDVSMQQIAEKSEFSVGTLYNFFESKDALFEELIKDSAQRIVHEFSQTLDGPGNERVRLAAFIRKQPEIQEKHGELIKLYVAEFGIRGSKLSRINDQTRLREMLNSKLAQLIEEGMRKGLFRAVDPVIAAKALGSTLETLIFETTGHFSRDAITEMFNRVEQLFLDGLLAVGDLKSE